MISLGGSWCCPCKGLYIRHAGAPKFRPIYFQGEGVSQMPNEVTKRGYPIMRAIDPRWQWIGTGTLGDFSLCLPIRSFWLT